MKQVLALLTTVLLSTHAAVSEPPRADLTSLEAALAAKPNDLKAGNDYRMAIMADRQYDRALKFFDDLTARNPKAANAYLNYAFAYVDKIPDAGAITQVILANDAVNKFSEALKLEKSWIGLYSRGKSYLFWPLIFQKANLGIADLEQALKIQRADKKRPYHIRVYLTLGDGYWKVSQQKKAMETWKEGLNAFPDSAELKRRLSGQPADLKVMVDETFDYTKRVDTSLDELWRDQ
jgi:tetratricopeptide (TPR) repeat protein